MFFGDIIVTSLRYISRSNHMVDTGFLLDATKVFLNGMVSIYSYAGE